ncbi:MAG: hypothetical protein J4G12_02685 [Gemmatimonadetes bacterium]|nr:hypothetical protein [Gemmatimonadota bacterium]
MSARTWSALAIALIGAGAFAFATLNTDRGVAIDLGFMTLRRVPVSAVAFGGFVAGLLVMIVAGIHSDLKVRRILRTRLAEEADQERVTMVDHTQRDLFAGEDRRGEEVL